MFEEGFGFERYVDYVLDVPMYFVYRNGTYHNVAGQSFRDFMDGKLPGLPGAPRLLAGCREMLELRVLELVCRIGKQEWEQREQGSLQWHRIALYFAAVAAAHLPHTMLAALSRRCEVPCPASHRLVPAQQARSLRWLTGRPT